LNARHAWAGRLLRTLLAVGALLLTAWGALALWFQLGRAAALALGAAWCLAGVASALALWRGRRWRATSWILGAGALAALAMACWWHALQPSHERQWADDVARLLDARVDGDRIVLHNVRNFDWRSETDYTARWETREYRLSQLASADLVMSYWMGPHIAHTLVSFAFDDGQRLVFSLEIRKERGESFSAIGGFFRRFEQVIVAADERDIVRTRSNARGEQVYLYRLNASRAQLRDVLRDYLRRADALRAAPSFYNTLTSNCTTILFELARSIDPGLPLDWRLLASGHFAEYAWDHGALTPDVPYAELRRLGHVNARALQADRDGRDYSTAIREGIPPMPPAAPPAR